MYAIRSYYAPPQYPAPRRYTRSCGGHATAGASSLGLAVTLKWNTRCRSSDKAHGLITDFVFMVDKISKMFITGPSVIETVLGEKIGMEELGGARIHAEITGNAHFFAESETECFDQIKKLLSFIPRNNEAKTKKYPAKDPISSIKIEDIVPGDAKSPYDVRDLLRAVVDDSDFFEIQEMWAANIVIGFGRINGESVGFVANQPLVLAGVLDS